MQIQIQIQMKTPGRNLLERNFGEQDVCPVELFEVFCLLEILSDLGCVLSTI